MVGSTKQKTERGPLPTPINRTSKFAHFFGFPYFLFFFETVKLVENGSSYSFSLFQNPLLPIKSETNTERGISYSIDFRMMAETNDSENAIGGPAAPVALTLTSSPVKLDDPGPARKKLDVSPCRRSSRDRNVRCRFELL